MSQWKLDGFPLAIHYAPAAIHPLIAGMEQAFRLQPWGGTETGGLLLGLRHPDRVEILACLEFPCDHEYGPAWELTPREVESFRKLIAEAGESVVGWYRSASCLKALFTTEDEALFDQLFPQQAMLALIIERTKDQPCRGILYARHLEEVIHAIVTLT